MCGRYTFSSDSGDEKLRAIVGMLDRCCPGAYKTGEIFPGDAAPGVIEESGRIVAVPAVFGFPGFDSGKLLINARAETAADRKSFAASLRSQRIILPASGFFEWGRDARKTKYLFTLESGNTVYLCGLYRIVEGRLRFVILTRPANASMAETHDRMPVIAAEKEVRPYLTDYDAAREIIAVAAPALVRQTAERQP